MMRPQPFAFIFGSAARVVWKAEDRLIAMIWSHFSSGNSSTGATCWMPALFTRMSTAPKAFSASAIMAAISAGLVMSAAENSTLTPNSLLQPGTEFFCLVRGQDAVDDEICAFLGESAGIGQADAGGRSGDGGCAVFEEHKRQGS